MMSANHRRIMRQKNVSNSWSRLFILHACMAAVFMFCLSGCNYLVFFGYLIGGPPQLEPIFEKETRKSFTDYGVRVAVVCYVDNDLKYQYDSIDHLLALGVAARFRQNNISVVEPGRVRSWLEENTHWDTPDEIGAEFDATYVVYIDMSNFSLYEHDSRHLYRGRAEVVVSVYEMDASGEGERIFSQDLSSEFPRLTQRSASEISYDSFRTEYLLRLSEEIGRMFFPYGSGDDVGSGT